MRKHVLRWLLLAAGFISLALAVLGAVLPVLPTTPLVLLAAACFAKSSQRFHRWLLRNPLFGPMIIRWQSERCISRRAKMLALALIVLSIGSSVAFALEHPLARVGLATLGFAVATYVWCLKTCANRPGPAA
jgi:uncharacterized membrane protein YbaN (DUF454 family)